MGLNDMEFGGKVNSEEGEKMSGDKIDTTAQNNEEQELQDKAEDAMENDEDISNDDIDADTSGDSNDEDEEEEEDEEESDEDDDSFDDESEDDSEEELEEVDNDNSKDEALEEETKESEESFLGEKKSVTNDKIKEIEANNDLNQAEKDRLIMSEFLSLHKDVIPESARLNFDKFIASSNDAFLHIDDSLHKLVVAVNEYRSDIPVSERLNKAYQLVFAGKIAKLEQKKGEVKAEIRAQKVNKAVSQPSVSSSSKSKNNGLTQEQRDVYKKMGVPIPKKYR